MLNIAIAIAAMLMVNHKDADRLRKLEPAIGVRAAEHIAMARAASAETGVDAELILAISWHETRLNVAHRQREKDGRISCGVMTSTPVNTEAECEAWIAGGYLAGARHVRGWLDARDRKTLQPLTRREALIGVAGGYRLIEMCRKGPVWIRPGVDTCKTPDVFDGIADSLREPTTGPASHNRHDLKPSS